MSTITTKLALAASATAMVVGLSAVPVAASSTTTNTSTTTTTTDKSINVNGNCSGVVITDVYQDSDQDAKNEVEDNTTGNLNILPILPIGNEQNNTANNNQSNSQSSSQSSTVTFAPDCSVTNVTQAGEVKAAQVSAPKGGVDAGAGAFGSVLGLGGSLTAVAGGAARLFRRG